MKEKTWARALPFFIGLGMFGLVLVWNGGKHLERTTQLNIGLAFLGVTVGGSLLWTLIAVLIDYMGKNWNVTQWVESMTFHRWLSVFLWLTSNTIFSYAITFAERYDYPLNLINWATGTGVVSLLFAFVWLIVGFVIYAEYSSSS